MFEVAQQVRLVPLAMLRENRDNWSLHGQFEPSGRDAWLVRDIAAKGVLVPLVVDDTGFIHEGNRRYRSAVLAGLKFLPCIAANGDAGEIFASAQLGRAMSVFAKCSLYRTGIQELIDLGAARKRANLVNRADDDVDELQHERDVSDEWAGYEQVLGCSRRTLATGVSLLNEIDAFNESGNRDKEARAAKLQSIFRERGLKPALRLLGEDLPAPDLEEADCGEWAENDMPVRKVAKKVKKAAVMASRKPANAWVQEVYKHLAKIELLFKTNAEVGDVTRAALECLERQAKEHDA